VEHVVIIGVDALSPEGIQKSRTPNLDHMMANGAYTLHARSVMPTVSTPNWASLLMGAGPEQTGITSNEWDAADYPFPPVVREGYGPFPTIFHLLKAQRPEATAVAYYDWRRFDDYIEQQLVVDRKVTKGQRESMALATAAIRNTKPALTFIYFGFVDEAGHHFGHGTAGYCAAVEEVDEYIGTILNAIRTAGDERSTLVAVCSDHGGIGKGHGGETVEEIEVPMIFYGAGVVGGTQLSGAVSVCDLAPTIAHALGLATPQAWTGKPVTAVFTREPGSRMRPFVKAPRIEPRGGFFTGTSVPFTMSSVTEGSEIFYTGDGSVPTRTSVRYTGPVTLHHSSILRSKAYKGEDAESEVTTEFVRVRDPQQSKQGLRYTYYEGNWQQLPDFSTLSPAGEGVVGEISLDSVRHRPDHFAVLFEGYIDIPSDGIYRFATMSDDGSRLLINDKVVVENDGSHSALRKSGTIRLTKGMHRIAVQYFDDYEGESIIAYYEGPGVIRQIIPPEALYRER
jgi:hypothetical protein